MTSKQCNVVGCTAETVKNARKHGWRYHSTPVPFTVGKRQYIVSTAGNQYGCPFDACGGFFRTRESIQEHVKVIHNGGVTVHILDYHRGQGSAMPALGASDALAQVLVPAVSLPQATTYSTVLEGIVPSGNPVAIPLQPSVNYLVSNPILDALGVPSSDIASILNFCSENNIYENPQDVLLPTPGGPPVQLIMVSVAGYACNMTADCTYCVKDRDTMMRHCSQKHHGVHPLSNKIYRECQVQRMFSGVGKKFFEIGQLGGLAPGTAPNLRDVLELSFLPALEPVVVVSVDTERERTPLIRFTAWDTFREDIRQDPKSNRAAHDIKSKHTDNEHDGIFVHLANAVHHHFEKAATILDGHPHKMSLANILLDGKYTPREKIENYWKPVSRTNNNYPNFMVQLTRCILRIHLGHQLDFTFNLSLEQVNHLERLVEALQDATISPRKRMLAYHDWVWSLIDVDIALHQEIWDHPFQRAIWLKALQADGNFYDATKFTPDLAIMKYLCNMTSLLEALLDKDQDVDSLHTDDFERVERVYEKVLRVGRPTTFDMLFRMQQFASSIAFNQTQEPRVFVAPDFTWISIGVERMHLDRLRKGIRELIDTLALRYRALTKDSRIEKLRLDDLKDDLTNSTRGYSFMSEAPFHNNRHSLLLFLVTEWNLAVIDSAGRIAWNIPEIKDFLRRTLCVWEPLYHLLYITTHISSRGTQFLEHQICNAERNRNLFVQGSEMFILTGYSKTTSITDRYACTPGFIPEEVASWVLELLGGGLRTAEAILAGVAYGREAEHQYRTYLCVGDGKRISPTAFSAYVLSWNTEYFDCRWGVRDFRQGAITMGREFISPNRTFAETDGILAESADHSTGIDHGHYAVVHGTVPRLSNNTMCQQRWLGDQWSRFLGFGPLPPQAPVRLSHQPAAANDDNAQSISAQVAAATGSILTSFLTDQVQQALVQAVTSAVQEQFKLLPGTAAGYHKDHLEQVAESDYEEPRTLKRRRFTYIEDDDDSSNDAM
ncbi:hypothetical protein BDR05DRAFT_953250 [Suillus weaverae]|nr:hypothetical protein BDR05DRAFT_953250 [Suillus weaverae]